MKVWLIFRDSMWIFLNKPKICIYIFIGFNWVGLNFVSMIPHAILFWSSKILFNSPRDFFWHISFPDFKWKIRISHWFAYLDLMNENIKNWSFIQKNTFQTPKEVDVTFLLVVFTLVFKISGKEWSPKPNNHTENTLG